MTFMLNMMIHKSLAGMLQDNDDTNLIISEVYKAIPSRKRKVSVVDVGMASNALSFYTGLFSYLNDKFLKIQEITIVDVNKDLVEYIKLDVIDKLTDEHIKYSGLYKKDTVQIQRNRNPANTCC